MTEDPHEWTDEQAEALKRWQEKEDGSRHPHDLLPGGRNENDSRSNNAVSPEECAAMRRAFKADEEVTIKELAETEFDYSQTTVAEHVFARRCSHDVDEGAAESPMGSIDPDEFVEPDLCAEMREDHADIQSIKGVAQEHGKTYGQAYHHLVGRCKCSHEVPAIRDDEGDS